MIIDNEVPTSKIAEPCQRNLIESKVSPLAENLLKMKTALKERLLRKAKAQDDLIDRKGRCVANKEDDMMPKKTLMDRTNAAGSLEITLPTASIKPSFVDNFPMGQAAIAVNKKAVAAKKKALTPFFIQTSVIIF